MKVCQEQKVYGQLMTEEPRQPVMRTWHSLLVARRRVLEAVSQDLKAAGLPSLDMCATLLLLASAEKQGLKPVELERKLELAQYTTSRLLDRMERLGLVKRLPCPVDGRSYHAMITEHGKDELNAIQPIYIASIERHLGAGLCDASAEMLADLLDRVGSPTPGTPPA